MEILKSWFNEDFHTEKVKEFEIVRKLRSNNVIKERVEIYKDFTINLLYYIYDTYLGKEYIKSDSDIEGHFNWAYGKVLEEFYDEEIDFYWNDELYDHLYAYFYAQFYKADKIQKLSYYKNFWSNIFELKSNKQRKIFDILLQIYEIFDISLGKKIVNEEVLV